MRTWLAVVGLVLASGCGLLTPEPDPSRFFVLTASLPGDSAQNIGRAVAGYRVRGAFKGQYRIKLRHDGVQGTLGHLRRRQILQQAAADRFQFRHPGSAGLAIGQVGGEDERCRFITRAAGIGEQQGFVGMMADHSASPRARFNRAMASRNRDLTVPSGMPSSPAIWLCGLSAKKESSIT